MNCKICNAEYEVGETICKNCGCDLPRNVVKEKIAEENKQLQLNMRNADGMNAADVTRNLLAQQQEKTEKMFWVIRILLILALLCYIFPFAEYKVSSTVTDMMEGFNMLFGEDIFEDVETGPFTASGINHITSKTFDENSDFPFTVPKSPTITISFVLTLIGLIISFLPMIAIEVRSRISAVCSAVAFSTLVYASIDIVAKSGGTDAKLLWGFILAFIFTLASAGLSAFHKVLTR